MKVLISPHNDDETLFAAFTLLRERPLVVVVFDGYLQQLRGAKITAEQRRQETRAACAILGVECEFLGFSDATYCPGEILSALEQYQGVEKVWAPAFEATGNNQHNLISELTDKMLGPNVLHYMTYTPAGKSTGVPVPYELDWIRLKLMALACYQSQITHPSCAEHFLRSQREYYQP